MKLPLRLNPAFRIHHSVFIAFFLLPLSFFLLLPEPALAASEATPYWRPDVRRVAKEAESQDPSINQVKFLGSTTIGTIGILGYNMLDPTGKNSFTAVNVMGSAIAAITANPPVQTRDYLAYMAGKAGFIDQAYAQGRGGFDVLEPVQKIWIATRNVAYLVTSLTLVVIGFMIMLRKKIDAQTVIGVQQALPKLVVTLLLITFSYAIVGFLIDMIYFITFFSIKLLAQFGVFSDLDPLGKGGSALEAIRTKSLFTIGLANIFRFGRGVGQTGPIQTAADAVGNLITEILGNEGNILAGGIGLISQPIAFIIFAVAILYAIFKLFFSLLMSYIQIILLTILGPLQLMLNALPGSEAFSKWFRNLLANTLAFPAAIMMIVFAAALMGQTGEPWYIEQGVGFSDLSSGGLKWIPPLVFGGGSGGGTTSPVDAVMALIGMGIFLMTPKVVDMVKEWVQAPEFKYGSAIGEAVGFGGRAPGYITRTAGSGREYAEALRYSDPASPHYDPNYLQQLMFTNPQLFTRVNRALSGGTRGRIIQGLGHTFGIGRK